MIVVHKLTKFLTCTTMGYLGLKIPAGSKCLTLEMIL